MPLCKQEQCKPYAPINVKPMVVGGRGGGWLGMKQNELIPRVLGIPRNSNLFQDIQMRKHTKVWNIWEYLRIDENTSGNFSEFLGIPNH